MSDIDFNEKHIGSENISNKYNNNPNEDKVCRYMSFDNKSFSDLIEPFCVQSDSDLRLNKIEIDSDIENKTPPIDISNLTYFDDNTSISCLDSENDSNSDLDNNAAALNTDHEHYDGGCPSTILSNVISKLNQSVSGATIVKIGNSNQSFVLNAPKSNPTENAKINVTTSGVGVLNIGDQFNGTNVNVIYCQEPKNPTLVLNSNENASEKPKESTPTNRISGIACLSISIIVILIIIASVIVKYEFWDRDSEPKNPTSPIEPNVNHSFNLIYRNEWHARPAKSNVDILRLPIEVAIIAHTATPWCEDQAACVERMRNMQTCHMDDCDYADIGYNFVVGGDGNIYVGRGWYKQGAHTGGWNNKSICIAFIGNYGETKPTEKQLEVTQLLLAEGVERKLLSETYRLYGHCQLKNFLSPGRNLYNIIKTWDHWTNLLR